MSSQPPDRSFAIGYHLAEANGWLGAAGSPPNSTILSYAGFELRLGLERLLLEYLIRVDGGKVTESHLNLVRSFKRGEKRIYDLEGHQRLIDAKFRLFGIMAEMLQLPFRLTKPNFGDIASRWHSCSEFCHIGWTCLSHAKSPILLTQALEQLTETATFLGTHLEQVVAWPNLGEFAPNSVPAQFIQGTASEGEVRAHFKDTGLWSTLEHADGRKEFMGTAVPPAQNTATDEG